LEVLEPLLDGRQLGGADRSEIGRMGEEDDISSSFFLDKLVEINGKPITDYVSNMIPIAS